MQNVSLGKCKQRRPRSTCAFAQSDQGRCAAWSGHFLSANRIIDYYGMYKRRAKARIIFCAWTGWFESAQFKKALFRMTCPTYNIVLFSVITLVNVNVNCTEQHYSKWIVTTTRQLPNINKPEKGKKTNLAQEGAIQLPPTAYILLGNFTLMTQWPITMKYNLQIRRITSTCQFRLVSKALEYILALYCFVAIFSAIRICQYSTILICFIPMAIFRALCIIHVITQLCTEYQPAFTTISLFFKAILFFWAWHQLNYVTSIKCYHIKCPDNPA